MSLPMRLGKSVIEDLEHLTDHALHVETIFRATTTAAASLTSLAASVSKVTGLPQGEIVGVLFALCRLRDWQERRGSSEVEFVADLNETISGQLSDWPKTSLDNWQKLALQLANILSSISEDHPVMICQKAQSLAYTHENLLLSARLITDFRPVFDEAGTQILETIIIHTLSIQYQSGHQDPSTMDFALDANDVRLLREACERAERKTKASILALKPLNPVVYPDEVEEE